jgi:phosphate transport system protein
MWQATSTAYRLRSQDASFRLDDADNELDQLATSLIDEVVASNSSPQVAVDLGLIARFYERLGDHAVNLSRRVELMSALSVASAIH